MGIRARLLFIIITAADAAAAASMRTTSVPSSLISICLNYMYLWRVCGVCVFMCRPATDPWMVFWISVPFFFFCLSLHAWINDRPCVVRMHSTGTTWHDYHLPNLLSTSQHTHTSQATSCYRFHLPMTRPGEKRGNQNVICLSWM